MKTLKRRDYLAMREGAEILEKDPWGEKVLRLQDGTILKLFRRKRLISSAALFPYAKRFARNADILARIGVPVPEVIDVFRIHGLQRDVVHYHPLPGKTLRDLEQGGLEPSRFELLKNKLTSLIIHLHDKGIYFRSLHIGNVICTPEGKLGLIDFSDMRIHPWALGKYLRERNMRRMAGIAAERHWLDLDAIVHGREPATGAKA